MNASVPTVVAQPQPKAWWFLYHLVRFRARLWLLNLFAITWLLVVAMSPGVISREFFDRLPQTLTSPGTGPLGLPGWLWWICAFTVLARLGQVAGGLGCQLTNGPFMFEGAALMQKNLFTRILELPGSRALPSSSGEAISRFREDADEAPGFMMTANDMVGFAAFALIAMAIMLRTDATITLVVFLPLTVVVAVTNRARTRLEQYRRASREATGQITGFIAETMGAVQAVQVANAERHVIRHFARLNAERLRATVRDRVFEQLLNSVFWNTVHLGTGVILLLAGHSMRAGTFTVGDFTLFSFFLGFASEFTTELGRAAARYNRLGVSFERLVLLLRGAPAARLIEPGPLYVRSPVPPLAHPTRTAADRLERLDVAGLTWLHPSSGRGIVDAAFSLEAGTLTVVTGRVGAGKTTLLQALLGLQPATGTVRWNGVPVRDPATFFTPPRCAYTPQVPRLFSESLRDNILMGLPDDPAALARALSLAVFDGDVSSMERGLDTTVGARGVRLSGGQIQRAAAARMLVREPELLVFDDLSSALDVETERTLWQRLLDDPAADDPAARGAAAPHDGQLESGLRGVPEGPINEGAGSAAPPRPRNRRAARTVLAVSHRRAALRRADQVVLVRDGRIEDVGTLDELLARAPEMQRIWYGDSGQPMATGAVAADSESLGSVGVR